MPLIQNVKFVIADSVADGGIVGAALAAARAGLQHSWAVPDTSKSDSSGPDKTGSLLNKLAIAALVGGVVGFSLGSLRRR